MLTCNYWPGGNIGGRYPYLTSGGCPAGTTMSTSDLYTDQDNQIYDLSGLCVDDSDVSGGGDVETPEPTRPTPAPTRPTPAPTSPTPAPATSPVNPSPTRPTPTPTRPTPSPTPPPVDSPVDDNSNGCPCYQFSGGAQSSINGQYSPVDDTCTSYVSASGMYFTSRTYGSGTFWGFATRAGTTPDWNTYEYCWAQNPRDPTSCSFDNGRASDVACGNNGNTGTDDGDSDTNTGDDNSDNTGHEASGCVVLDGWELTRWGGGFEQGQFVKTGETYPGGENEQDGYAVYKWSEGEYYLYVMPGYLWYTLSPEVGLLRKLKGWCGVDYGQHTDILDCDGVWGSASNVMFRDCNADTFVFEPCLDGAAQLVRFLEDEDRVNEYMEFALLQEAGCWNNEPVWQHTTDDDELYFMHRDVELGSWQITMELVEGDIVYQCFEDTLSECTAGTWNEFETTEVGNFTTIAVREMESATVEVGSSAEESEGLSTVDDLAIVLVVLLVLVVGCVVALLWCRRNRVKGDVSFDAREMGGVAKTSKVATDEVGDTVDVGTDEEN